MRWVLLILIVAAATATVAVLATPKSDTDGMEFHAPETDEERTVADAGMAYLRAVQQRRPDVACRYAGGRVGRDMRCASAARLDKELYANSRLKPFHIRVRRNGTASLWVSGEPGPVQDLGLRVTDRRWRVVAHGRFGFQ